MTIVTGYKVKEACIVVHDVSQQPWGYRILMDTPKGDLLFLVSGEGLAAARGAVLPTVKGVMRLSQFKATPDYSGRTQMLHDLFARRFIAPNDTLIPYDHVSRLCEIRYGKPYHVYRGIPLDHARVVIAPRGSGIIGVDCDPDRVGSEFLFKRKDKTKSALNEPFVIAFEYDGHDKGYSYLGVKNGCLTFADRGRDKLTEAEVEYLLSLSL